MKKKNRVFLIVFLAFFANLKAQVGINTTNPQATLDIRVDNPNNPSSSTGVLIPSVAVNPSSGKKNGQLIFNTTNSLFYFWNGTIWTPITNQPNSLNSDFIDSRNSTSISINQNSSETVIPGVEINFSLTQQKPVKFNSTINFKGITSAFSPKFKLKLTNLSNSNTEVIDQVSNTFLSDGLNTYLGNLSLFTIKSLPAGDYKVEVIAYYNDCCKYDFTYEVGGSNYPVSLLIERN